MEINLTAWLGAMSVGALLCAGLFGLSLEKSGRTSGRATLISTLTLVLGILFGILGGKLLFILFSAVQGSRVNWTGLMPTELSYYGCMGGVCFAAWLTAKMLRENPREVLNCLAPAGSLMAALARFAEYWLGLWGTGAFLGEEKVIFPLAVGIEWDPEYTEYYLAVFMLEGLCYLLVAGWSLLHRKDRYLFVRTVFYLCLTQVFCESLRDSGIKWLFIHMEQLLCYLTAEGILIGYGVVSARRGKKNWMPMIVGLVVCALTVAEEFALDKTDISHWITYACMAAGLAAMAWAEHRGYRRLTED